MRDTVLIVDDVRVNREILSEILEQDYFIMTAEDGKEALDILYENEQSPQPGRFGLIPQTR